MVSSYIGKLVKKIEWQMKAYFFIPKKPISTISVLAIFKIACATNRIGESAGKWVLAQFIYEKPDEELKNFVQFGDSLAALAALLRG